MHATFRHFQAPQRLRLNIQCINSTAKASMIRTGRGVLYESTLDCLLKTAKSEGPMTVFRGFNMQWLRLGPHTTISLMCFEQLRHLDTWKHVLSFSSSPFQNLNFDSYSTPRSSTELRQNSTAFLLLLFVAFFSFHSLGLLLSRVANPPSLSHATVSMAHHNEAGMSFL